MGRGGEGYRRLSPPGVNKIQIPPKTLRGAAEGQGWRGAVEMEQRVGPGHG